MEKELLIENLALLLDSGMGVDAVLIAIQKELKDKSLRKKVGEMRDDVQAGKPLWQALDTSKLFPAKVISLIHTGEDSGRLSEFLRLVNVQMKKEAEFRSSIKSALLYPAIVLGVSFIVIILCFTVLLPKLTSIFAGNDAQLPVITRVMIGIGTFFTSYGIIAIPLFLIVLAGISYVLFINKNTKHYGDSFLLSAPGIGELLKDIEIARFGYVFGSLVYSGFLITDAFSLMADSTGFAQYRNIYLAMRAGFEQGNSFEKNFSLYPRMEKFLPISLQQLIISGEKTGKLAETMQVSAGYYEQRADTLSKNLAVVLEPIVLIVVGLIVAVIAIGVISPIYGLVQQI